MDQMPQLDFNISIIVFLVATLLIVVFGTRATRVAAALARQTWFGEALMGVFFMGAFTSLAEIATTITAATNNHPQLAISNAVGSIAGQTAFLAIVDFAYRKANLEHAAASAENLTIGAFLMTLLALPLLALAYPGSTVLGVHPITPIMIVGYFFGLKLISLSATQPMWYPQATRETKPRQSPTRQTARESNKSLWLQFLLFAVIMAVAGWFLAISAVAISKHTHLSESLAGALLTGVVSSLPEFITAYAAVKMGALTLAVGNILGGNAFDTLLVAIADLTYPHGSIYTHLQPAEHFLLGLASIMTGTILLGMLQRQKHGFANIGLESSLVLLIYAGGIAWLIAAS